MTTAGSEAPPFEWEALVPHLVHPIKVAVIEALLWVDQPLSSTDLMKLFCREDMGLSHISYHVRALAKMRVLKKVRERRVRGSIETFYRLR